MAEFIEQLALRVMATRSLRERLSQDEVWTDAFGKTRPLEDLTPSHVQNLMGWLEKRARQIHDGACGEYVFATPPTADMASYYFEQEQAEVFETSPQKWLAGQPLMVRLTELATEYAEHK